MTIQEKALELYPIQMGIAVEFGITRDFDGNEPARNAFIQGFLLSIKDRGIEPNPYYEGYATCLEEQ